MNNIINEGMNLKISKEELKRFENISKKLNLKLINAEKKKEEMHETYNLSKDFSSLGLSQYKHFKSNKMLKYFQGQQKWELLLRVMNSSASGDIVYKEKLSKKLNCSQKTLTKYIDECIDAGFFVYLDPVANKIRDKRIINIRPSEDLAVEFINYKIEKIQGYLKFCQNHCKIDIKYEF